MNVHHLNVKHGKDINLIADLAISKLPASIMVHVGTLANVEKMTAVLMAKLPNETTCDYISSQLSIIINKPENSRIDITNY